MQNDTNLSDVDGVILSGAKDLNLRDSSVGCTPSE